MRSDHLTQDDYKHLESSWITRELALRAGISRVSSSEGAALIGRKDELEKYSGLIFPYRWPGDASVRAHRLRVDNAPLTTGRDGKPKRGQRYVAAPGSSNRLYFGPDTTREQLDNSDIPIVITEGEKKTLALSRLALHDTSSSRFVAIGLSGVWNWRGKIGKVPHADRPGDTEAVSGPIADLERIPWTGRMVYICFDADVQQNQSVQSARKALARELARRGAKVSVVDIPIEANGKGIDDVLGLWGPDRVLALFQNAKLAQKPAVPQQMCYAEKNGILVRYKGGRSGSSEEINPLTTFSARILTDIWRDDGEGGDRFFEIEAVVDGRISLLIIRASEFEVMTWPTQYLGAGAAVYPNQRDHARFAIQAISGAPRSEKVFTHSGWREIDGHWVYLHSDGGIGVPQGQRVHTELPGALKSLRLEPTYDIYILRQAVQSSLGMLDLGPDEVTFPIVAAVYRAAMGPSDFSIFITGRSGTFKSEIAALAQQHYGHRFDARHLPANFMSTSNAIESLAFHAKDALFTVDDFAPHGSRSDLDRYHAQAERLFRGAGNTQGRLRLRADAKMREERPPRCTVLSTGEDVPRVQSVRARLFVLEVTVGTISTDALTVCQAAAAAGAYAQAMGGFLRWVAPRYEDRRNQVHVRSRKIRQQLSGQLAHARTGGAVGELHAGFELMLDFALDVGAITELKYGELQSRCWTALNKAALRQGEHQVSSDPAERFIGILRALIATGRAHCRTRDGGRPDIPGQWGWSGEDTPSTPILGWIDDAELLLDPEAAFGEAQRYASTSGEPLAVGKSTLKKRLSEKGYLLKTDQKRETLTIRRRINGRAMEVLCLDAAKLASQAPDEIVGFTAAGVGSMSVSQQCSGDLSAPGISRLQRDVGFVGSFVGRQETGAGAQSGDAMVDPELIAEREAIQAESR